MRSFALPAILALAAPAGAAAAEVRAADAPAVVALARQLAQQAAALAPPETTRLAVAIDAPARRLGASFEAAFGAALRDVGFAPPLPVDDAAGAVRAGADALAHVRVDVLGGVLVAAGDVRAVRDNFFTGAALAAGGALAAQVGADAATRVLAGGGTPQPFAIEVTPFARLGEEPLALAVGSVGGVASVAALGRTELVLFDASGAVRARYALPPPAPGALPSRDPRAGLVVVGDGVRYALPLRGAAEVLRLQDGALVHEADAPADVLPAAAGAAGTLAAMPAPGTNLFAPTLLVGAGGAAPRAVSVAGPFVAALAAPAGGGVPFGLVSADGSFAPLRADLSPAGPSVSGVGDAAALADLDGDGVAELVASERVAAAPDRVRVVRLGGTAAPAVEAREVDAVLVVGASGTLGDGDEAIFGATDGALFRVRRAP